MPQHRYDPRPRLLFAASVALLAGACEAGGDTQGAKAAPPGPQAYEAGLTAHQRLGKAAVAALLRVHTRGKRPVGTPSTPRFGKCPRTQMLTELGAPSTADGALTAFINRDLDQMQPSERLGPLSVSEQATATSSLNGIIVNAQGDAGGLTLTVLTAAHGLAGRFGCAKSVATWPALSPQGIFRCTDYLAGSLQLPIPPDDAALADGSVLRAEDWSLARYRAKGPEVAALAEEALAALAYTPLELAEAQLPTDVPVAVVAQVQPSGRPFLSSGTLNATFFDFGAEDGAGILLKEAAPNLLPSSRMTLPDNLHGPQSDPGMSGAPVMRFIQGEPAKLLGLVSGGAELLRPPQGGANACIESVLSQISRFGTLAPIVRQLGGLAALGQLSHEAVEIASTSLPLGQSLAATDTALAYHLDLCLETLAETARVELHQGEHSLLDTEVPLGELGELHPAQSACDGVPWQHTVAAPQGSSRAALELRITPASGASQGRVHGRLTALQLSPALRSRP